MVRKRALRTVSAARFRVRILSVIIEGRKRMRIRLLRLILGLGL